MMKKKCEIKWKGETPQELESIKDALSTAPILASLHYTKDFQVFSFVSKYSIGTILVQKEPEGLEKCRILKGNKLKNKVMTWLKLWHTLKT